MDDLSGLLVEGFGFRPRDRAPMAASKARAGPTGPASTSAPTKPPPPRPPNPSPSSLDHGFGDLDTFFARPVPDDDLFGGFPGVGGSAGANDDIFGSFPSAGNADSSADLLGDFGGGIGGKGKGSGGRSSGANSSADLLGDFGRGIGDEGRRDLRSGGSAGDSAPAGVDSSADLLGDFGGGSGEEGMGSGGGSGEKGAGGLDELNQLLPGFGGSSPPRVLEDSHKKSSAYDKLAASMPKDPFIDLESTVSASHSSGSFTNTFDEFDILSGTVKSDKKSMAVSAGNNIFDAFEGSSPLFASDVKIDGKPPRVEERANNRPPAGLNGFHRSSDVDLMFAETKMESDPLVDLVTKPSNPMEPATMKSDRYERNSVKHVDSADDIWFSVSATSVKQPSVPSSNIRKAASSPNILDDWNSLFGAPSSQEFQEIEGETEERRRARYERHQRTLERAAKALNEKNERDIQIERENAERHRIAERLDADIKRWAAGKEGNLRALLSSLQYMAVSWPIPGDSQTNQLNHSAAGELRQTIVLWSESGWQPVTITDLITSASVKKVYRKATLCIHPDKVQQKGANLEQKYTAEKVFDLLKEAWKKFNMEELS